MAGKEFNPKQHDSCRSKATHIWISPNSMKVRFTLGVVVAEWLVKSGACSRN